MKVRVHARHRSMRRWQYRFIRATASIARNGQILGGEPCFVGTRVPVASVLASVNVGVPLAELVEDYPFLTPRLLDDARMYVATQKPDVHAACVTSSQI